VARSSAGKYDPNVDELRTLFTLAPQLATRIRDLRAERVAKIVARQAPVILLDDHLVIIHIVPFSAFDVGIAIPIGVVDCDHRSFPPLASDAPRTGRINVDGVLRLSNGDDGAARQRAYVQLYRSGVVEAVASSILQGERPADVSARVRYMTLEAYALQAATRYLPSLNALGVVPPYAFMMSLVGMSGAPIVFGDEMYSSSALPLDREQFHFSEVVIETLPAARAGYAELLRPLFDQISNAGGRARSPSFDDAGRYLIR
jgi:hypothetical protein